MDLLLPRSESRARISYHIEKFSSSSRELKLDQNQMMT
jgi:hypothetical protein